MTDDIRHLVRLQEIAFEILDLEQKRIEGPARLAALDQEFEERVEEIGGARLRHEELSRERQILLQEREDLSRRLENAQKKLMQVTNQREYSAALNEIDTMKARRGDVEQYMADRESEIEELAGPATEADERIAAEQTTLDEKKKALEDELAKIDSRLTTLNAARDEIKATLPSSHLQRFDRIFRARGGIAVAQIDKTACGACHVKLRPQIINLCRRGEDLVACDSCRRILFIADEPENEAPAAASKESDGAGLPGRPAAGA
ncbi:MAG: C4-type zinc ribbon domain-containing protein [Acidobacteriota bacterium]|nr:C4-type zinc ribbon domain-containing protein [Acidobacteriota bacterium]